LAIGLAIPLIGFVHSKQQKKSEDERLAMVIAEMALNAGETRREDLLSSIESLEEGIEYAQSLGTEFINIAQRENAFSKQALDNQELLRLAELDIRRAKGETITSLDELSSKSEADAAKRQQEAQATLNLEQAKLDTAKQSITQSQDAINLRLEHRKKIYDQMMKDRKRLILLETSESKDFAIQAEIAVLQSVIKASEEVVKDLKEQ
jgi:hypothetical protein